MDGIKYTIKEIDNIPRIFVEIYSNNEFITEYQILVPEDINKLDSTLIEDYINSLDEKFDYFILEVKNSKNSYNEFTNFISSITEVLRIKFACLSHIERMDIIE